MIDKLINISKYKKFIVLVLIVSTLFGCYQAYADGLTTVRFCVDGDWRLVKTNDESVSEFLTSQGIVLGDKDIINVELDDEITDEIKIIIQNAINVNFVFTSGEVVPFTTNVESIGKAINEFSSEIGRTYRLAEGQSSSSKIYNDMDINLLVYEEVLSTYEEEIAYSTQTVENNQVLAGTQNIKTSGVNGVKEVLIKDVYLEGELISSYIVSETVLAEPVNEVIEIGTMEVNTVSTEKGIFVVNDEFVMKATAYTSSGNAYTASGMKAQVGVVAVDPKVIPLGTKLYIEGYGYAVAGDTGGAIKGNKVDLYFNTYSEAINYGVRQVKVYVLGEQI